MRFRTLTGPHHSLRHQPPNVDAEADRLLKISNGEQALFQTKIVARIVTINNPSPRPASCAHRVASWNTLFPATGAKCSVASRHEISRCRTNHC